ncbi:MAG: biopolymer transporter ExbD [Deltaproteobacteria bacterium]|nr:biopolymer transporter ExbD [Deltaproteobacteria bacterium]
MSGGGGGGGEYDVQLNLVPLIDILTNILFFLLVGFAAQEIAFEAQAGIKLPAARTEADLKMAVSIALSADELSVEKVRVAKIIGGKVDAPLEGDKIVPLYEKLNTLRAAREGQTGGVSEDDDVIFLIADRQVPFTVLSPVMKTAAMAGFPNFRFAVVKR